MPACRFVGGGLFVWRAPALLRPTATLPKTYKNRPPEACWANSPGVLSVLAVFERASSVGNAAVSAPVDPFLVWRLHNAGRMTADDLARGHDAGGYCAAHGRLLSYPEQKRGACSWCVSVDQEREPEYWPSRWRRFTEWR